MGMKKHKEQCSDYIMLLSTFCESISAVYLDTTLTKSTGQLLDEVYFIFCLNPLQHCFVAIKTLARGGA